MCACVRLQLFISLSVINEGQRFVYLRRTDLFFSNRQTSVPQAQYSAFNDL